MSTAHPPELLSVIVVSWNTCDVLRACLRSVDTWLPAASYELIVVDNASQDGSADMVAREFAHAHLLRQTHNLGFGAGANLGMAAAHGDLFLLLNSDALLVDGSLGELAHTLRAQPADVGLLGPRLMLPDGRLQVSARRFPSLGRLLLSELWLHRLLGRPAAAERLLGHHWDHASAREADWLVGACLLLRREVFARTGGFDASIFLYGEEVEWCRRVRAAGYRIAFRPEASVRHLNHRSAERLFGDSGRLDRCVLSEQQLLRRWQGPWRAWLADGVRLLGSLLRLLIFGLWHRLRPRDTYVAGVLDDARAMLAHYGRRLRGRTWQPPVTASDAPAVDTPVPDAR
jgi:hypothetical protein